MKTDEARKLRVMAARMENAHPETQVHGHLRDAARALDRGDTKAASRHLAVARHTLTPVQLYRHGILSGDRHATARTDAGELDRRMLALRDIHDIETRQATAMVTRREHQAAEHGKKEHLGLVRAGVPFKEAGQMGALQPGAQPPSPTGLAAWHHAQSAIALSAQTARLAETPAPRGKPGGPGLYSVRGMGHTPYLQEIVKALIEKRGMPEGKAYAIARAAIRRWSRGGGKVHPEVRAAAGAAEAGELGRQARAKSMTAADVVTVYQLAVAIGEHPRVIELFNPAGNPAQARVPVGQTGAGQFTAGGGAAAQQKQQPGKKPATKAERARAKAQLEQKIKGERAKLKGLRAQLNALLDAQRNSAKAKAQATKAGQTGKSAASTPAKKQQATKTAAQPGAAKAAASSAANTAAKAKAGVAAAGKAGAKKMTATQHIAQLRTQIAALSKTIATQSAQAAKL